MKLITVFLCAVLVTGCAAYNPAKDQNIIWPTNRAGFDGWPVNQYPGGVMPARTLNPRDMIPLPDLLDNPFSNQCNARA